MARFSLISVLLLSFCLVLTYTKADGDVDENGVQVPVAGTDESEQNPEPDDDVFASVDELALREFEGKKAHASIPPNVKTDSQRDKDDDDDRDLSNQIPPEIQDLLKEREDELSSGESGDDFLSEGVEERPDNFAASKSIGFTKKYWYYPPSPVRCAGQLFDPIRYFCCNGKITYKSFYYRYQTYKDVKYVDACCCGVPYNTQTQICCKDKIYDISEIGRPNILYYGCCGDQAYDNTKKLCCDGKLFNKGKDGTLTCCGCDVYRRRDALCCNGVVVPHKGDKKSACCGTSVFYPSREKCCDGCPVKVTNPNQICCGHSLYNRLIQICCGGKIYYKSQYDACCENSQDGGLSRPYKIRDQICCGGRVYKRFDSSTRCCSCYMNGKYTARIFNSKSQACCGCRVYNMPAPEYTHCCCKYMYYYFNRYYPYFPYYYYYPKPYYYHYNYPTCRLMNPKVHSCCNGNIFVKFPTDRSRRCCNSASYLVDNKICCNGQIRERAYGANTRCCGTETYDGRYHVCCYNQVLKIFNGKNKCCGYELYNPTKGESCCKGLVVRGGSGYACCGDRAWLGSSYGCCDGKPYYRKRWSCCKGMILRGGDHHDCCGSDVYDKRTHYCCGNCVQPLYSRTSCCGSISYDTTKDVCCTQTNTISSKRVGCPS